MADLINSEVGVELENRLREKRQALALSQKKLADLAGITRQAISALESDQYSPATSVALQLARALLEPDQAPPATSVALQLARALRCRVEDLFNLKQGGQIIEGELLDSLPKINR